MTAWAGVMIGALLVAAVVAWPRRRRRPKDDVRGVRWRHDPETGLRDYYATPWLRGEKP